MHYNKCMGKLIDITGNKFGRLTAIKRVGTNNDRRPMWLFKCDCGNQHTVNSKDVISGHSSSCGCLQRELLSKRNYRHGKSTSKEYSIWAGVTQRVKFGNSLNRKYYLEKGITMCDRWSSDRPDGFTNFLSDMGPIPSSEHQIDRIDPNGNYEPSNCRWVTRTEQMNNTTQNVNLTFDGVTMTQEQWGRKTGLGGTTICKRLKRGWTIEKALNTPLGAEKRERFIEYNGVSKPSGEWAQIYDRSREVIAYRLAAGMSVHDTFTKPLKRYTKKHP